MSIDDAVKRLRGPKGTPVHITVVRQDYDEPLEFTVLRDEIPLHSVPYYFMASANTGYIRLQDFNETTACRPNDGKDCERELEKAVRALLDKGATSLILDIRDNPGGLLDQAFAVSNRFLRKGQLVVFTRGRTRRDESSYVTEGESRFADLPLVVLTSQAQRQRLGDRGRRDPGPRPRPHRRRDHVRQGARADHHAAAQHPRLRAGPHHRALLHAVRPVDPARLRVDRARGLRARPRSAGAAETRARDVKLTDAGRKVYGGDGITPDYCVEPETPTKFVSYLIARQAIIGFSRGFAASGTTGGAEVAGAGSRSGPAPAKVRIVTRDFKVDEKTFGEFRAYLDLRKLKYTPEDLETNREAIERLLTEEVLRQVFGEGEARRRSMAWDPQVRKALELVPRAEQLLRDPQQFVAAFAAETKSRTQPQPH